jgi:hypothetical protein
VTRVLPRLTVGHQRLDAFVTPASFARSRHGARFDRMVAAKRPLPAGFRKGLTCR